MTSDKEQRVLEAAQGVFFRYGFARTTMADVAQAAGVSRPALYLVFPGKEELFSAVIHRMNTETLQTLRAGMGDRETLEDRLLFAFELWVARAYDAAYASPDAKDLFSYAFPAMREVAAQFEALLADLLRGAAPASSLGATPEELARTLLFAVHGFKAVARDGTDLRRMTALQVSLTVKALGAEAQR